MCNHLANNCRRPAPITCREKHREFAECLRRMALTSRSAQAASADAFLVGPESQEQCTRGLQYGNQLRTVSFGHVLRTILPSTACELVEGRIIIIINKEMVASKTCHTPRSWYSNMSPVWNVLPDEPEYESDQSTSPARGFWMRPGIS